MIGYNHLIIATTSILPLTVAIEGSPQVKLLAIAIGAIAGLVPDLDTDNSILQTQIHQFGKAKFVNFLFSKRQRQDIFVGIFFAILSIIEISIRMTIQGIIQFFKLFITHRGITHTILSLLISTALIETLIYINHWNWMITWAWAVGFTSHLIADSMTRAGIQPFLPFSQYIFHLFPEEQRIKTRSYSEYFVTSMIILFNFALTFVLMGKG